MIHFHGSPLTPEAAAAHVFSGRHAMVSFAHPQQLPLIADVCQSFALDNGAFSAWRSGKPITDWRPFFEWVQQWDQHPGFDWFLIPDVIDGDERQNDKLVHSCGAVPNAVPIWHLHESIERLQTLAEDFPRIAFGSSGDYAQLKTSWWWARMSEAMDAVCDAYGKPKTRLHGLRMLDPEVFTVFPFASADSTNVARNVSLDSRWNGTYAPPSEKVRGIVLAERIEAQQSAATWTRRIVTTQLELSLSEVNA